MSLLEVEKLNVHYGAIHAVRDVSLSIEEGQVVTLIGANGAGKSSVIRSIMGLTPSRAARMDLRPPDGKTVPLQGRPTEDRVKMGIALSPEGRRILPHLTAEENLRLGAWTRNDAGGEQQMLSVGRALMSRPNLLMLDEPSLGLAPILVEEVFNIIRAINAQGRTILLVEQNAWAALKIAHRAYVLEVGAVALSGTGEELLNDARVRSAYLGG